MKLQKLNSEWVLKDGAFVIGTAKPHRDYWHIFGRNANDNSPVEAWAKTERQAKWMLKEYCGA